jgi:hypothetical protein
MEKESEIMRKLIKIPLIIIGSIFGLFIALIILAMIFGDSSNSETKQISDSSETKQISDYIEIEGNDLNSFLNLRLVQNNPWQADVQNRLIGKSIQEVIYSGGEAEGHRIGIPKKSIKVMNSTTGSYYYSIDIFKTKDFQDQLLAQLVLMDYPDKKDEVSLYSINVEGVISGSRLMGDDALEYASKIFPNSFFDDAISFRIEANRRNDLRNYEKEATAALSRTPNRPRDLVRGLDFKKEIGVMIGHIPTFAESRGTTYGNPIYNIWTPYSNKGDRNIKDGLYTFSFSRNTIINEFKPFLNWFKNSDEMSGGGKIHNNEDELYNAVVFMINLKTDNSMTEDQFGHPIFRIVSTDNSYRIYVYGYKDESGTVKCLAVVVYNI